MRTVLPTGFAALDRQLPGGGWPYPALIELLLDRCGLGEIGLLVPALRELQQRAGQEMPGMLAWLNPPYIPYAPGLAQRGLELQRQLVSGPLKPVQTLWAMEQALRSASLTPAHFLGLERERGVLIPGARADLVALDGDLAVVDTWIDGSAEA